MRLAIACSAAVLALAAPLGTARAQSGSVAEQTVDTLNKIWGAHQGFRANHAKGVVLQGSFAPSAEGPKLSKAVVFQGKPTPVTVRFSDSSGAPNIPDGAPPGNPHGMAIKFHLADGSDMDAVLNSLKFFPVANGEDFLALQKALAASPPTASKPTALDMFVAAHPAVPKALATVKTPTSFARESYNGIDAFIFVDAAGKRHPFRYKVVPAAGEAHLDKATAAKQPANFLMDEIQQRVKQAPVVFDVMAQLAEDGDPINDPTKPWPDGRTLVKLGTLTLDKADPDSLVAQKTLFFLPANLTDGIEMSDDPLIAARNAAYGISFSRRAQ